MKKNLAIILAGGTGSRITEELPKQFLLLAGKPIIGHSIEKFENHPSIHHIFIVTNGEYFDKTSDIVREAGYKKVEKILRGGAVRQESSRIGVYAADPGEYDNVLIHDAARPFVSEALINDILLKLETHMAVNVAIPSPDTILEIDDENFIKSVPQRKYLRRVQTPQAFKMETIRQAHQKAVETGFTNATDDCSLILHLKKDPVYVVEGSNLNIKITYPIDLHLAEKILEMEID